MNSIFVFQGICQQQVKWFVTWVSVKFYWNGLLKSFLHIFKLVRKIKSKKQDQQWYSMSRIQRVNVYISSVQQWQLSDSGIELKTFRLVDQNLNHWILTISLYVFVFLCVERRWRYVSPACHSYRPRHRAQRCAVLLHHRRKPGFNVPHGPHERRDRDQTFTSWQRETAAVHTHRHSGGRRSSALIGEYVCMCAFSWQNFKTYFEYYNWKVCITLSFQISLIAISASTEWITCILYWWRHYEDGSI